MPALPGGNDVECDVSRNLLLLDRDLLGGDRLAEKTVAYSLSPGKARRSRPIRWHHLPGRPQAGSYADRLPRLAMVRLRARRLGLGCRNVLSFDAKPIPGLGLLHRTHWGSLIGVGVAIGIGIESAHRSKQPARYQSLIPTSTLTPTKHPKTGKRLF
jgi:hypothetical protein